jgi:hypothetical protein
VVSLCTIHHQQEVTDRDEGSHALGGYGLTFNHMNSTQAIQFVKTHGVVLESARGSVPSFAETIAGERLHGSWWAHPKAQVIFRLTRAVRDSDDILVCRLMHGKVTYVHQRLWPALVRLAKHFDNKRLGRIREVHTLTGEHELQVIPFPRWVPEKVKLLARKMSERDAVSQLGEWYIQSHNHRLRKAE